LLFHGHDKLLQDVNASCAWQRHAIVHAIAGTGKNQNFKKTAVNFEKNLRNMAMYCDLSMKFILIHLKIHAWPQFASTLGEDVGE